MSTNYSQDPDIQAYLDLNRKIQQTAEVSGGATSNSIYFNSANFALTWALTANIVPAAIRLSTLQSYVAYYGVAFVGEFISEMLERNGKGGLASYFGNDYDNLGFDELDFGDEWYDDLGESIGQAAIDTLMGIQQTIDFLFLTTGLDPNGLKETLKSAFENNDQPLFKKLGAEERKTSLLGKTYTVHTYEGTDGNNYIDASLSNKQAFEDPQLIVSRILAPDKLIIYGRRGDDYITNALEAHGGNGDDFIENSGSAWGGNGKDYIKNTSKDAYGEGGKDYITGTKGNAYGGYRDDFIENTSNAAYGGIGDDILLNNRISKGEDGNDYIVGSHNHSGGNILDGGAGDDYLEGRNKNETLLGGTGADILIGGGGNDTIDGGENPQMAHLPYWTPAHEDAWAPDVAVFRNNANFTFTKLSGDWEYQVTGQGTDKFKNIESIIVEGGTGNNTIDASALDLPSNLDGLHGNDILKGGANSDIIVGGLGNDTLQGNGSDDFLIGGLGNDTYKFDADTDLGTDTIIEAQKVALQTAHGTYLSAWDNGNVIQKDWRSYWEGFTVEQIGDKVALKTYHDTYLQAMNDGRVLQWDWVGSQEQFTVSEMEDSGTDTLDFSDTQEKSINVDLSKGAEQTVNENLTLKMDSDLYVSIENVFGGQQSDTLLGNARDNLLQGNSGADTLLGQDGHDRLYGKAGNDSLLGGNGQDILDGGEGSDILNGGSGADTYVLKTELEADLIQGFQLGIDKISLPDLSYSQLDFSGNKITFGPHGNTWVLATLDISAESLSESDFV